MAWFLVSHLYRVRDTRIAPFNTLNRTLPTSYRTRSAPAIWCRTGAIRCTEGYVFLIIKKRTHYAKKTKWELLNEIMVCITAIVRVKCHSTTFYDWSSNFILLDMRWDQNCSTSHLIKGCFAHSRFHGETYQVQLHQR